jgi:hypothetical protein
MRRPVFRLRAPAPPSQSSALHAGPVAHGVRLRECPLPIHGGASAAVFHRLPEPEIVHSDGPVRMRQFPAFRSHGAANACARSSVAATPGSVPKLSLTPHGPVA